MVDISASMATQSSEQDGQKSGPTDQMEGQTLAPPNGQNGPEETEASCSVLSCSPSQSLVRRPMPDHPEIWYCLEIQVILTEEGRAMPPPPHTWQVPVVEDMLGDGKSSLTVIVMGPGQAILFYGRQSLGEGLTSGEVWDTLFTLSGALSWIGKQAQLNTNALCLQEHWWLIAQAITEQCAEARGPGCPHSCLPAPLPFRFHSYDRPPWEERLQSADEHREEPRHTHQMSHHDWDWTSQHGWDHSQKWQDLWVAPTLIPSPSPGHGLRVTEVQCQLPHWCHHSPIDLEPPGIHTMVNVTGSQEAIWRLICQSSRMRTRRKPSIIKVGIGI